MQLLPSYLIFLSFPCLCRDRKAWHAVVNGSRLDWKLCSKANGLVTGMPGEIKAATSFAPASLELLSLLLSVLSFPPRRLTATRYLLSSYLFPRYFVPLDRARIRAAEATELRNFPQRQISQPVAILAPIPSEARKMKNRGTWPRHVPVNDEIVARVLPRHLFPRIELTSSC